MRLSLFVRRMGVNEHMLINGWARILKTFLEVAIFILLLGSGYYIVHGRFGLAGVLFIAAGILSSFWGFPYFVFFILYGLMFVLVAYKMIILSLIVALVAFTISVFDMVSLNRLMESGKLRTLDKSKGESPLKCMRENEITFKLWNKLKLK